MGRPKLFVRHRNQAPWPSRTAQITFNYAIRPSINSVRNVLQSHQGIPVISPNLEDTKNCSIFFFKVLSKGWTKVSFKNIETSLDSFAVTELTAVLLTHGASGFPPAPDVGPIKVNTSNYARYGNKAPRTRTPEKTRELRPVPSLLIISFIFTTITQRIVDANVDAMLRY